MSEQLEKARNVLLDRGTSSSARRSEVIPLHVDGETVEVEVRAPTYAEINGATPPDEVVEQVGEELAHQLALICECTYLPGEDTKLFGANGAIKDLADAPFGQNSYVQKLVETINYVTGYSVEPPDGVDNPQLQEIESVFTQLEDIADEHKRSGEKLDPGTVADIAKRGRNAVSYLDRGVTDQGGDEGNKTTH